MALQVRMLGGFAVSSAPGGAGGIVRIPAHKARALLAVLALRPGEPQGRESLAALLWPDTPDARARGSLRQALKQLRRCLRDHAPDAIVSDGDSVVLNPTAAEIDAVSFRCLCLNGRPEALTSASELYRGDLLEGFVPPSEPFAEWTMYERSDLRESAVNALSKLVERHAGGSRRDIAVRTALRLLALDPLQEQLHRLLMRLYLQEGRRGAVVEQYEACRAILRRELGVEPEAETEELYREARGEGLPGETPRTTTAEPVPARPAVAVLPFNNLSGDPTQSYFSDGLTEDIITALTHWRSFPVIARNSTFAYEGKPVDIKRIARELGAGYLLEGSVRREGARVRITAQLIDGVSGHHVWADKYDRDLGGIFEVQDEITQRICATVAPELTEAEARRATAKRPEDLDAWDCWLRGMAKVRRRTPEDNAAARALFEQAVAIRPDYGDAYTGIAMSCSFDIVLQCAEDQVATATRAMEAAQRAVALDETSAIAHRELSTVYQLLGRQEDALAEGRIAVDLNPNDALALHQLGNKSDLAGLPEGIAFMEKAQRLNPKDAQLHTHLTFLARAYLNRGDYQTAADRARRAIQRRPEYPHAHYVLAIALAVLGREDEGRSALSKCDELHPGFVRSRRDWQPYLDPRSNEALRDGLCRLGIE